jgi:hypothetical protein
MQISDDMIEAPLRLCQKICGFLDAAPVGAPEKALPVLRRRDYFGFPNFRILIRPSRDLRCR